MKCKSVSTFGILYIITIFRPTYFSISGLSIPSYHSSLHYRNKSMYQFRKKVPKTLSRNLLASVQHHIDPFKTTPERAFTKKHHNFKLFSTLSSSSDHNYTPPDPKHLARLMPERNSITGEMYTTYEKCVRRLYLTNLFHPVKLGLSNMEKLHDALGNPMDQNHVSVIHVAGTNGKGSVALKIAKIFEMAGYDVGLFVSPHIASFRERMQMNSEPISEQEVEELLPKIYNICEEEEIPATFFEVTTALAFAYFQKRNANVVVLETGLGGRLDATNVITSPKLCVITSIGLEHTRILGHTIELIAKEKAGIMKAGVPVLVGPDVPHQVMEECASEKQTDGYYKCNDLVNQNPENVVVNGIEYIDYDLQNAMIAKAALKILESKDNCSNIRFPLDSNAIEEGTSQRPPCRFEERIVKSNDAAAVKVIFDVAHNPPAIQHLVSKLKATYPDREKRIVAGFSADKDLKQCGEFLLKIVEDPSRLHLVEAAHPRAAKLEDIIEANPKMQNTNFDEEDRSITAQVNSALEIARNNNEILVICGSVFLMAEAREAIGIDEPKDSKYIAEVAGANLRHGQEFFANSDPEQSNDSKK